jgi:hypothetical protein
MFHSCWHDRAWDHLLPALRSGKPAFEIAHGLPAYDWLRRHPAAAEEFHSANAVKARRFHQAVLAAYDFSGSTSVADIGGGQGALMLEILSAHPHLEGLLLDLPEAVEKAEEYVSASDAGRRCRVIAGDFFAEVPGGSDVYVLANVLHNWDDDHCRLVLSNCRKAMPPGSNLLVIEALVSPGNSFSIAKLVDIEAMVMGAGCERTETEYRNLLTESGFGEIKTSAMMDGNALLVASRA